MKFRIESTNWWKTNELIIHYPCLTKFGLEVEQEFKPKKVVIEDDLGKPMEFEYGCDVDYIPYVTIETIEELINLQKAVDHDLIVKDYGEPSIEIYDGYRE